MVKLTTEIQAGRSPVEITFRDKIMLLGSCFSAEIGERMLCGGFNVCVNPFGALYNPLSIETALELLCSSRHFTEQDCVMMGAGAGKWCSFFHHTSFARENMEEFLQNANAALDRAREFWAGCNRVIITLGTAFVWENPSAPMLADGSHPVCNCLKLPQAEFTRRMLEVEEISASLERIERLCKGRGIILTVSPIRHLSDGAHANALSKSSLLLGLDRAQKRSGAMQYFPSYELVLDELRDYRFFADDLVHPGKTAIDIIWERFIAYACPELAGSIRENEKVCRQNAHRPIIR